MLSNLRTEGMAMEGGPRLGGCCVSLESIRERPHGQEVEADQLAHRDLTRGVPASQGVDESMVVHRRPLGHPTLARGDVCGRNPAVRDWVHSAL